MSGLRVALDATPAIAGRTGISIYVSELAAALEARGAEPKLFAVGRALAPVPPGCRHLKVPSRLIHRSWAVGGPPRPERLVGPVDLVHSTGLRPPPSRVPVVATVHDVAALEFPDLHRPRLVAQVRRLVEGLDRASVVLVDSVATGEALQRLAIPADKIALAYPGLRQLDRPAPGRLVDGPYLLAVGEQMPRKGLAVLLEAFATASLPDVQLVHAGPPSDQTAELLDLVERLGLVARVHFLGYVESASLAALFRDALALCFPSVAEGFGLPVLEAMAAGLPVVASDIPPVREIARDAALLTPPNDIDAFAASMERVVQDEELRARLVKAGHANSERFTWDACAVSTIAAYQRAVDLGSPA